MSVQQSYTQVQQPHTRAQQPDVAVNEYVVITSIRNDGFEVLQICNNFNGYLIACGLCAGTTRAVIKKI